MTDLIFSNQVRSTDMNTKTYWVIKCPSGYWLEEGGVTPSQGDAERFKTKIEALRDLEKWLHPGEKAWVVAVIAKARG